MKSFFWTLEFREFCSIKVASCRPSPTWPAKNSKLSPASQAISDCPMTLVCIIHLHVKYAYRRLQDDTSLYSCHSWSHMDMKPSVLLQCQENLRNQLSLARLTTEFEVEELGDHPELKSNPPKVVHTNWIRSEDNVACNIIIALEGKETEGTIHHLRPFCKALLPIKAWGPFVVPRKKSKLQTDCGFERHWQRRRRLVPQWADTSLTITMQAPRGLPVIYSNPHALRLQERSVSFWGNAYVSRAGARHVSRETGTSV